MNWFNVKINNPNELNMIIGQSHFIKTVEDVAEIMATRCPHIEYGFAFCEASQDRLVRVCGNKEELKKLAIENALSVGCGHSFIMFIDKGFPINVIPALKDCQEIVNIFCATANPVEVIVCQTDLGRGIMGVIDGETPLGVEGDEDVKKRKDFLRMIGYKH